MIVVVGGVGDGDGIAEPHYPTSWYGCMILSCTSRVILNKMFFFSLQLEKTRGSSRGGIAGASREPGGVWGCAWPSSTWRLLSSSLTPLANSIVAHCMQLVAFPSHLHSTVTTSQNFKLRTHWNEQFRQWIKTRDQNRSFLAIRR